MNVGIGNEAAQFHFREFLNQIFGTMQEGWFREGFLTEDNQGYD